MDPTLTYTRALEERRQRLATELTRSRVISLLRVTVAALGAALFFAALWGAPMWRELAMPLYAVLSCVFLGLLVLHAKTFARKELAEAAVVYFERGLLRLAGRFREISVPPSTDPGETHPYADDLDIFGKGSLWHLLDLTGTAYGARTLQRLLADGNHEAAEPTFFDKVRARQQATQELASNTELREALFAHASRIRKDRPDPEPLLVWAESGATWPGRALHGLAGKLIPCVTIACLVLAQMHVLHTLVPAGLSYLVGLGFAVSLKNRTAPSLKAAAHERSLAQFGALFECLEGKPFESAQLRRVSSLLAAKGAGKTMRKLGRIVSFLEARESGFFSIFLAPALLWDVNCAAALEGWREDQKELRSWFLALGEVEALASLGAFAFEHPHYTMPEFASTAGFDARGLAHPLLQGAVANDIRLPRGGRALIVTGSNMAGKSTMLRAVGINAILARAGAPVFATSLVLGPVRVATSMRVRDSLSDGVSRFYAELRKLKVAQDLAQSAHTEGGVALVLLDEVLAGTNLRERLIGARSLVRTLLDAEALALVSTHDLELGELSYAGAAGTVGRHVERVSNVHFLEQVEGDVMSFDYKLREGVVTSSNALRLMKSLGLAVEST